MNAIDYTSAESIRDASTQAENERNRLFKWMQIPEFQGDDQHRRQIRERIQSKCRSLARIRDSLAGLADKIDLT